MAGTFKAVKRLGVEALCRPVSSGVNEAGSWHACDSLSQGRQYHPLRPNHQLPLV